MSMLPNYELTPCALQPVVGIIDRDNILESGRVNSELTDIAWYRVENGVEGNALVSTPRKHVITSSGNDAGKLLWYVNAAPQNRFCSDSRRSTWTAEQIRFTEL